VRAARFFRIGFLRFNDRAKFREITPPGYGEGPFLILKDGQYYFMWSEGDWIGPDYAVAYAIAGPSGAWVRLCSRTDRSLAELVIIKFCMSRSRIIRTSCITALMRSVFGVNGCNHFNTSARSRQHERW
jgi:hypothetical protein